ncbi:flagellar protein FlhE [Mixta tenebrionis]|uniref:Flagellar protein FlhE n=2 Tax=Mixta tenebrionis TaxID=2562439 RepID=A0A506VDN2_9GAMM|nr:MULTISPECIES: flagellar protein FlhE [Mixta]QHM75208.1 Flagellar protein FlhE [Mixta theicola]TPW43113.1 flagellar protein FlhE [Mixta tenebrionis]
MRFLWLALALLLPLAVQAAGGAWQGSAAGVALSNRGVEAASAPISPPDPISGVMTLIYWRFELTGPQPAGLQVKLCSSTRCTSIEGASGATRGLTNVAAGDTLRFIYSVPGQGRLFPVLRVRSNQVMVNYQ